MRLAFKRNSQIKRLASLLFKGKRKSSARKHDHADDQKRDIFIPTTSEYSAKDGLGFHHNARATDKGDHLQVLYHILQKQRANTAEFYSIAGQIIKVEVLEDTEL